MQATAGVGRVAPSKAMPSAAEHVGAAASARCRPIAVLDDGHAGAGEDKGSRRADVERAGAVAAGAAGIENAGAGRIPAQHVLAEDGSGGRQLACRFALHAERHEPAGRLGLADLP